MRAAFVYWASAALCFSGVAAVAQTAPEPSEEACPAAPVSVYFASGEVTASPQTQALLGKIRQTATSCQPDRIDLVAHIDPGEGETAWVQRAQLVADELMAAGLSANRIHVAGHHLDAAAVVEGRSLHAVEVTFRRMEPQRAVFVVPARPI